ncbi:MAG: hypothetical protein KC912_19550 [Proteobacteria bacterium]|nr:hypothetical protein [Pseudomonadota bacterium]
MRILPPLLLLAACTASEPKPLVEGVGWMGAEAAMDLMPEHEDAKAICGAGGFREELGGVEVDTGICAYALLQHPLLEGFAAQDTLTINWWHSDLVAAEPATGHLMLSVGEDILYEAEVDIPGDASAFLEDFEPGFDVEAGEPLVLHLHNHGFNTWNLFSLTVEP